MTIWNIKKHEARPIVKKMLQIEAKTCWRAYCSELTDQTKLGSVWSMECGVWKMEHGVICRPHVITTKTLTPTYNTEVKCF